MTLDGKVDGESVCENASIIEYPFKTEVDVYVCSLTEGLCADPREYACFNKSMFRLIDSTVYNPKDNYTR